LFLNVEQANWEAIKKDALLADIKGCTIILVETGIAQIVRA
jgi:hypothetical protein